MQTLTVSAPNPISIAATQPVAPTVKQRTEMRICSVYPVRKEAKRRHATIVARPLNADGSRPFPTHGLTCDTTYIIEAAPRDGYSVLAVFDALQPMTGWSQDGPKENTITPGHIPVDVVASDLVNSWASQTIVSKDGYKPGIGIIAGELPTEAELAKLREQQRAFFEFLVQDANDKFLLGETKNITNIHRNAAGWLLGDAAQQLAWFPKMEHRQVKDCPRCAKQILSAALGCEHCSLDLVGWYERYAHLTPDSAVSRFLAQIPVKVFEQLAPSHEKITGPLLPSEMSAAAKMEQAMTKNKDARPVQK